MAITVKSWAQLLTWRFLKYGCCTFKSCKSLGHCRLLKPKTIRGSPIFKKLPVSTNQELMKTILELVFHQWLVGLMWLAGTIVFYVILGKKHVETHEENNLQMVAFAQMLVYRRVPAKTMFATPLPLTIIHLSFPSGCQENSLSSVARIQYYSPKFFTGHRGLSKKMDRPKFNVWWSFSPKMVYTRCWTTISWYGHWACQERVVQKCLKLWCISSIGDM